MLRTNPSNIADHHFDHLTFFTIFNSDHALWKTSKMKGFSRSYQVGRCGGTTTCSIAYFTRKKSLFPICKE